MCVIWVLAWILAITEIIVYRKPPLAIKHHLLTIHSGSHWCLAGSTGCHYVALAKQVTSLAYHYVVRHTQPQYIMHWLGTRWTGMHMLELMPLLITVTSITPIQNLIYFLSVSAITESDVVEFYWKTVVFIFQESLRKVLQEKLDAVRNLSELEVRNVLSFYGLWHNISPYSPNPLLSSGSSYSRIGHTSLVKGDKKNYFVK